MIRRKEAMYTVTLFIYTVCLRRSVIIHKARSFGSCNYGEFAIPIPGHSKSFASLLSGARTPLGDTLTIALTMNLFQSNGGKGVINTASISPTNRISADASKDKQRSFPVS